MPTSFRWRHANFHCCIKLKIHLQQLPYKILIGWKAAPVRINSIVNIDNFWMGQRNDYSKMKNETVLSRPETRPLALVGHKYLVSLEGLPWLALRGKKFCILILLVWRKMYCFYRICYKVSWKHDHFLEKKKFVLLSSKVKWIKFANRSGIQLYLINSSLKWNKLLHPFKVR